MWFLLRRLAQQEDNNERLTKIILMSATATAQMFINFFERFKVGEFRSKLIKDFNLRMI